MYPNLSFILSCLSVSIMSVVMPAQAAIVVSDSYGSTAMLARSLLSSDLSAPGSWAGSENGGGSSALHETPLADGAQYDFLQACCSGESLAPGISLASADSDPLAYADSTSPLADFSAIHTSVEPTVLIAADTPPPHGREPYIMLIFGLSLLGLAAVLYPKSANTVPAETSASNFAGWDKRKPRRQPPATDVPSSLKFS